MSNWSPTSPLFTRQPLPRNPQDVLADLDDWSIAELLLGERFEQPTPDAPLAPTPSAGARAEPATASQPAWLANAQWHATPGNVSWPERPAIPRSAISDDPFERAAISTRHSTPRRSPMGPPFLNQPPSDYPSHLGPVRECRIGRRWCLAPYGGRRWQSRRVLRTGARPSPASNAAARKTANTSVALRREGGVSTTCRPKGFPAYISPGEPTYHSYDVVVPGRRRSARSGIERDPTPGPYWSVAPATAEGTPNSAVPPYVQFLQYLANLIPAVERRIGSASWPVASHAVVDQYGRPAVMNVTNPDHPGFPGVVVRAEERLPSGNHRLRNQSAGLSALQSPNLPGILRPFMNARDAYTDYLWRDQSQDVIDRVRRNPRYGRPLE